MAKFATGFPFVQHKIANQLSELDIGYPESPLIHAAVRRIARLHGGNVPRDKAPVKGWRSRGYFCGSGAFGPAADAPGFEVGGLGRKGMSGCA